MLLEKTVLPGECIDRAADEEGPRLVHGNASRPGRPGRVVLDELGDGGIQGILPHHLRTMLDEDQRKGRVGLGTAGFSGLGFCHGSSGTCRKHRSGFPRVHPSKRSFSRGIRASHPGIPHQPFPLGNPSVNALSRGETAEWAAAHSFTRHASAMPRSPILQATFGSHLAASDDQRAKFQH